MNIKYISALSFLFGITLALLFWPKKQDVKALCAPIQDDLNKCRIDLLDSPKRCLKDKQSLINTCKNEMDIFCSEKIKDLESACNEINCSLMELLCLDK
jgi:hypothetical protein